MDKRVDDYIANKPQWKDCLTTVGENVLNCGLAETIKWNLQFIPTITLTLSVLRHLIVMPRYVVLVAIT